MDIKKNTKLIITIAVVLTLLVVGGIFLFKKDKTSTDSVLDQAQETLDEMQGEESDITFDGSISQGESIDILFRFRDYANVPDDPETLQETEDALIPVEGNATIKITEIGRTDQIDEFHQASEGKELYYIVYEYIGDENNPNSLTIHPRSMNETGWDPAPQFVIIEDGDDDYSSSTYSKSLLESLGYDASSFGPDLNEEAVWAGVWEIEEGITPTVAFKYTDMDGVVHYVKVEE
jgi:hypothetical protein